MARGWAQDILQLKRAMTKEQANATFLRWVSDQHASWASQAAMGDAAARGEGDSS